MENKSLVRDKSFLFSVRIVKLYQYLSASKKEFILSKQLVRSGTSIGANIHEAVQGTSKRDFIYKLSLSLKEANETAYWLKLLKETEYITSTELDSILPDCNELIKMLTSIIKTSKLNS